MLVMILGLMFASALGLFLFIASISFEERPRLRALDREMYLAKKSKNPVRKIFEHIALINRPMCLGPLGARISRDLSVARVNASPEEFFLIKEIGFLILFIALFPKMQTDMFFLWFAICFIGGYMGPEFWLKAKTKKIKAMIIKDLPDTIDLLGLCVNAGLDFMLALKWVIEKSTPSVLVDELNLIMQEINVGKPRRAALSDFAKKYDLPDVSTFTRTLIQADRMGTSMAEALNILSEDMRLSRFRRGEQLALKAPMKMLVPLLFFIFPVVGILVAGPIFLDFMRDSPVSRMGGVLK